MRNKTKKTSKYFPILRTGKLKDSKDRAHTFTKADLDNIATQYNKKGDDWKEAPVVTGHPKTDTPAFGWIESLKRFGNKLYARAKDVVPAFAGQVKKKMYKYVSPSFRPDGTLRHVGFLGATPPAIAGLGEVNPAFADFAGDEEYDSFEIDFAEMESTGLQYIVENIQKGIAALQEHINFADEDTGIDEPGDDTGDDEPEGIEEGEAGAPADEAGDAEPEGIEEGEAGDEETTINQTNIKELDMLKKGKKKKGLKKAPEQKVATPPGAEIDQEEETETSAAEFSEPEKDEKYAALLVRIEQLETEKVADKAASFAEGLVNQGKLLPKLKHGLTGILTRLDNTESFDFAEEGADEKDEKTLLQAVMDFCEAALGERIPLKAIKRGKGPATGSDDDTDDYSEADPDQLELDKKVKAEMAKENIDYAEALSRVEKGGK